MIKRLRYYLDRITDNKTTTYRYNAVVAGRHVQKEAYDGECEVWYMKPGGKLDRADSGLQHEPTFWHGGIAYKIIRTNRLAADRPTFIIAIPVDMMGLTDCTPAGADFCLRTIAPYFEAINAKYANISRPDRENGKFILHKPCAKVLVRNASYFAYVPAKNYEDGRGNTIYVCEYNDPPPDVLCLCVRIEVQLPYMKLDRMRTMLSKQMPDAVERFVRDFDHDGYNSATTLAQTAQSIRNFLAQSEYCAFIANGSILARKQGTDLPDDDAVPFVSPPTHEIEVCGIRGLGLGRGVTVITGGGYSGKSTVLNAISAGIYNHVSGDGRELCITDDTAVTITAEDGRAVSCVNISPFIKWIPGGDPAAFSTTHASGSTSQGANIIEAMSLGARLLLIDEDRSATNFMIRDALMKRLIEREPITPLTERVREIAANGTSTILVIGGSGEYISISDTILMMNDFVMSDATAAAKSIAPPPPPALPPASWGSRRTITATFSSYPDRRSREKLNVYDTGFIAIGDERIDIRTLHDIATKCQTNALAFILRHLAKSDESLDSLAAMALKMRGLKPKSSAGTRAGVDIVAQVHELYAQIGCNGLDVVDTGFFSGMDRFMDLPRVFEVVAAVNRMRGVEWTSYS